MLGQPIAIDPELQSPKAATKHTSHNVGSLAGGQVVPLVLGPRSFLGAMSLARCHVGAIVWGNVGALARGNMGALGWGYVGMWVLLPGAMWMSLSGTVDVCLPLPRMQLPGIRLLGCLCLKYPCPGCNVSGIPALPGVPLLAICLPGMPSLPLPGYGPNSCCVAGW